MKFQINFMYLSNIIYWS